MEATVLVTDIQRFCVNDGPGFRTNVYLKGCPLRCRWCHNPETVSQQPEIYWKRRLCVQCGACLDVCPRDAIEPPVPAEEAGREGSGYYKIHAERCDGCMKCVDACLTSALEVVGKPMTVEEILEEVLRDKPFYDNSGGGMTLSGGEPTFFPGFSRDLLREARARGVHTCMDTNGYCAWETLQELAGLADIVLYDLKHIDREPHREYTGAGNERILENLGRLSATGKEIWIRIPVIPGFNDDLDTHRRTAAFLASLPRPVARVDLLPFHNWCQDKYGWLGRRWPLADTESLDPVFLEVPARVYRECGLPACIGGSGFEGAKQAQGA